MYSDDLKAVLKLVNEVLPLPDDGQFKGNHAIVLDRNDGELKLCVWYTKNGKILSRELIFNEGNEEINKALLENVKEALQKLED